MQEKPIKSSSENSRRWFGLVLLCAAQFMVILDFSIVNIALPSMQRDLNFSQQNLQWVISIYALTFGGFLLLGSRAADLLGRRLTFMAGLALFSLASLIGGLAQFQAVLICARAFQGIGAAIVSPTTLSLLSTTFKEGAERNRALGIWGGIGAGGLVAGVISGGLLTEGLGWRWVMFINVPTGFLIFALTRMVLNESRDQKSRRHIDLAGAVTVTTGLIVLIYALVRVPEVGFTSIQVIVPLLVSLFLLATFVVIESCSQMPLVPLGIFRMRILTGANIVSLLVTAASASMIFILTLYMQSVLGYSPSQTGLALLPHAIASVVAAPLSSYLVTSKGVKSTMITGIALSMLGLLLLTRISTHSSFVQDLLPGTVITAVGVVLALLAGIIAVTTQMSDSEQGLASGLLNTSQQIGAALGLALITAISSARTNALGSASAGSALPYKEALVGGFRYGLTMSFSFAAIGILIAFLVIQKQQRDTREIN